jgi:hypothetical protein
MIQPGCRRGVMMAFLAAGLVFGQTRIDLRSQGRNVDFADAAVTRPFTVGTTLPANCSSGAAFFKSDAAAGKNLYLCTATDTWTLTSGDHSVVTVATLPPAGANAGKVFIVSDAADKGDCTSGGGFTFTACVSDGSGWSPVAGAKPPFVQEFSTPATEWAISGASHGLGTRIEVFVQTDDGTNWRRADPSDVSIHKATGDVTVNWATGTVGRMMITNLAGTGSSGGGGGGTSDHSQLLNLDYASSGHTGFARAMHASEHMDGGTDEIATSTPLAYGIPKAGSTGQLDRNWLPVMQGDSGSGGARGAVPAPQSGDAGRCLKGDGTWGDCGGSGTGDNLTVNSEPVSYANFNSTTPAAPSNARNVLWHADGGSPANVSAYVPVMTGDAGAGGQAGLVPAPQTGDAANCLKGDGTWGTCATGSGHTIQDEGNSLPSRTGLNFTGAAVQAVDDSGNSRTNVTFDSDLNTIAGLSCSDGQIMKKASGQWACAADATGTGGGSAFDESANLNLSGLNQINVTDLSFERSNSSSGTALHRTVCINSSGLAVQCTTSTAARAIGICKSGCGTSGTARITIMGVASCDSAGAVTAGNWVSAATTADGKCQDAGTSKPSNPLGIWLESGGSAGLYQLVKGVQ